MNMVAGRGLDPVMPGSPHPHDFVLTYWRPILVADPDPAARHRVAASLAAGHLGNPVVELADGDQAIAELRRLVDLGPGWRPVLLVLDRDLPGTSGLDVVRWMRGIEGLAEVPVVVLSAEDGVDGVVEAYGLGVRSYLVKPVGFEALSTVVRDLGLPWLLK
jgi:DNA-binding response OmpR family regulator